MASCILLINYKGEVLIYRNYKYDVSREETMEFCRKIIATKESNENPIIYLNGVSYLHTREGEISVLATTKSNSNAAMILNFLYALIKIFKSYFDEFSEKKIKENFVLIYELLDEIMDYGYPQLTDSNLLKKFITQEGYKNKDVKTLQEMLTQVTGAVSWRPPNVFHSTNEIYLDVIESINLLINKTGEIIKAEVNGVVTLKSLLSGDPICKFGMNDKLQISQGDSGSKGINIEDIRFHQCVRLSDFNKDRTITFIPPDGKFDLMTFRVTENVIIPFKLYCNIIETPMIDNPQVPQNIDLDLNVKAIFDKILFAQDVVIKIQIPKNATDVKMHTNIGKAKHEFDKSSIVWRIKKVNGEKECKLKCEIPLISTKDPKPWTRSPISMEFNIPTFTASGLRVRYLKVQEKSGYKPLKWIRYITKGGDFQFRI